MTGWTIAAGNPGDPHDSAGRTRNTYPVKASPGRCGWCDAYVALGDEFACPWADANEPCDQAIEHDKHEYPDGQATA